MHGRVVDQRPGQRGEHRRAVQQIAVGIDAGRAGRVLGDRQRQLYPLVVRELAQKGGIALDVAALVVEIAQKFLCEPVEERIVALVPRVEVAHHRLPGCVGDQPSQHWEGIGEKALDVVVEQLAVDLEPALLDAGRRRRPGVAQMGGELPLQLLEFRHAQPLLAHAAPARC